MLLILLLISKAFTVYSSDDYDYDSVYSDETEEKGGFRPRDCLDLFETGQRNSSNYVIFPKKAQSGVDVHCDMTTDGGGWTVIQRRGQYRNGVYHFYRDWNQYKEGFGNVRDEYWIGNEHLHSLTSAHTYTLLIQLLNDTGEEIRARYRPFKVGSEGDRYKLNIGKYNGKEGYDALSYSNGAEFSTFDKDHNKCAEKYRGAWWYKSCHYCNLNGLNFNGEHISNGDGINWSKREANTSNFFYYYSYPWAEMKIRRYNPLKKTKKTNKSH